MSKPMSFSYDAFIAYAGPDIEYARKLDLLLSTVGHSVFMAPDKLPRRYVFRKRLKRRKRAHC